jgi:O-antigen ligase
MLTTQKYLSVMWLGALVITLAIAAPWFDLSISNHSFVKTYIGGIGIGILTLVTILKYRNNDNIVYHISYIKIFLGTTFLLGLISIFWSVNPDFSIVKLLIWITAFMAFYVAYRLEITELNLRKLSFYLVISAGIIAIIGILQYLFDPFTLTQSAIPSSTFGNKNMATQPISMIFPLAVFLILNKNSSIKIMWIAGILGALMLTFNFYTSTRASWIAIIVEVILMGSLLIIKRKSFKEFASWNGQKTVIAITSLLIFFILINFNENGFHPMWEKASAGFERLTTSIQNDKSFRYLIWEAARNMIADNPYFGSGLGTWFHNLVNEGYSTYVVNYVQRVHNDLLELAVSIGLIGFGIFMAGVFAIIYAIWSIILKANNQYLLFYFALFESLSGSFVNLQFSFPYQLAMPALLFGLYVGLIAKKSEEFISPIKVFKLNFSSKKIKLYKNTILLVNVVIFTLITSIYLSWAKMYSGLNELNMKHDFDGLNIVETPIYHLETQNILNFLTQAYMAHGDVKTSIKIAKQMLKYWPNDYISRIRYSHLLFQQKKYMEALREAKKAKKVSPLNSILANSNIFQILFVTKKYKEYTDLFNEIMKIPESILAKNPKSYSFILSQSLRLNNLKDYAPKLYKLHYKYNKYDCNIENNILYYYLISDDEKNMSNKFKQEIQNPKNCLNKSVTDNVKLKFKNIN